MANNNDNKVLNVPNLRFPEFCEEWYKVTLRQIASKINTKNKDNVISTVFSNSATQGIVLQSAYFDKEIANKDNLNGYFVVEPNDFVYNPRLSANAKVGAMSVNHTNKIGLVSPLYTIFRVNSSEIHIDFLESIFKSNVWHSYMRSIANFGARDDRMNIKNDDLFALPLSITSIEEQRKIAKLLNITEERIATQNKIIEDLKKLKSAISAIILFSDSWIQYQIKDIASIGRGRVINSTEISQQNDPIYPVYSSQTSDNGIMGYLDDYMFDGEYVSWTTDGANAGTVFYRNGKFNCTNVCGLLKLKDGFDAKFISLVLAYATRKYVSINLANPKLMNNTMGIIQIAVPKIEEQKRIASVFNTLDNKIDNNCSLLNLYSSQKTYLLQQMFI